MRLFLLHLVVAAMLAQIQAGDTEDTPSPKSDSTKRALNHLRALRDRPLKATDDFTILGQITEEKSQSIDEQLEAYHRQLRDSQLRVIKEKSTERLAAVLISRYHDHSPFEVEVHGVALVRQDDTWSPAPIFASFENTGLRYIPELAESARQLESWMRTEIPRETAKLRQQAQRELLETTRRAVSRDFMLESSPEEIVLSFVRACRNRDLPTALAHVGGLDDPLPASWENSLLFLSDFLNTAPPSTLEPLLSAHSMHVVMHRKIDRDGAHVDLGEYYPAPSTPFHPNPWRLRPFTLKRSSGDMWQIVLPEWLQHPDLQKDDPANDHELQTAIPLAILNAQKPESFPTASALFDSLAAALDQASSAKFFSHLDVPRDTSPERAADILMSFTDLLLAPDAQSPRSFLLDFQVADHQAAALVAPFDPSQPAMPSGRFTPLKFIQSNDAWSLYPKATFDIDQDFPPDLATWINAAPQTSEKAWLDHLGLMRQNQLLPDQPAPTPKQAKSTISRWIRALKSKSPRLIFAATATFRHPNSHNRLFSYLQQELPTSNRFDTLKIHTHGAWAAATVRHSLPSNDAPYYILHPMAMTPDGPRIFPEAILYSTKSRARKFLNENAFAHLEKILSDKHLNELKKLLEMHVEFIKNR